MTPKNYKWDNMPINSSYANMTKNISPVTMITFKKKIQERSVKEFKNEFLEPQFLQFSIPILKNSFISQLNIILTLIWGINNTSQDLPRYDISRKSFLNLFTNHSWYGKKMITLKLHNTSWHCPHRRGRGWHMVIFFANPGLALRLPWPWLSEYHTIY